VSIGLFLLGSMRVERDFQYAGRDSLALDADPFLRPELLELIAHLERLDGAERRRELSLLHVPDVATLRVRLDPRITARTGAVHLEQVSFDGLTHLSVLLEVDAREAALARAGSVVTVRSHARSPVRF